MDRKMWLAAVVFGGGLLSLGLSVAHEGHSKHLPDAKDIIAFRNYLMENVGDHTKELKKKIEAGKVAEAKVNAQAIALHATRIPELFPPGSTSKTSRAKEEIWQQWDDFRQSAAALQTAADELAVTAAEGAGDKAGGQLKKVFGTCKGCHDSFRKPDER